MASWDVNKSEALPLFDHRLRPYQRESHTAIRNSYRTGKKRILIELPTGTGKTRTFTLLPKDGARSLIIVPMLTLIEQTVKSIRSLRNCSPDVEQAGLWAVPETEFVVASWHSLIRNDRYKRFVGKVDLVVVDEAHWGFTTSARDMLNALVEGGARVLGVTATAYRGDKQALCGFYEEVAYCLPLRKAIDDGWLVPPRVKVHYVKSINLDGLAKKAGADFQAEELDKILRSEEALQDLAALITRNHRAGAKGIVFAHSIKQAILLRDIMVDRHGMTCSLVHSKQSDEVYASELKEFMVGDRELIINVGILTTGWDFPPLSEIFLAKPTKALNKYTQMIGRATRSLEGVLDGLDLASPEERRAAIAASAKPSFVIHDITDSSRCHKLCSALDVLSEQTGKARAKVVEAMEEKETSLEELDAAVAAEMEQERQEQKLNREAERKRRRGIVVGVEWDSEDRDAFAEPDRQDARRREWRCPFGKKWKGQPMKVVDKGWIEWALRSANLTPMWRKVFVEELDSRRNRARFDIQANQNDKHRHETPSERKQRLFSASSISLPSAEETARQLEEGRRYAMRNAEVHTKEVGRE